MEKFDLIIQNGTVCDGTRTAPQSADIAVKDGIIVQIAPKLSGDAEKIIDAEGQTVSPGFIDIHSHSDSAPFSKALRDAKIQQGITTELCGNCGGSYLMSDGTTHTVDGYAQKFNAVRYPSNIGLLVGHGTLRDAVMGNENRRPSEAELQKMAELLDNALAEGAFGLSFGLIYPPSAFAEKDELVYLAKVAAKHDALVTVHMRNEGAQVFESVAEMLSVAEEAQVRLEISHLKLMHRMHWGKADRLVAQIEAARARGVRVTCDQYPFAASCTNLSAIVPHWAHSGGTAEMLRRLAQPTQALKDEIQSLAEARGGFDRILIGAARHIAQYETHRLSEIAEALHLSPVDAAIKLLLDCEGAVSCIYFSMNDADVLSLLRRTDICICTDSSAESFDKAVTANIPHPRAYASFPAFFEKVRENRLLPIQDAVYKCTGLPAEIMQLKNRGKIQIGAAADIVIFDANQIAGRSTYEESRVKPSGISYVIVNGQIAVENGTLLHCGGAFLKAR